MIAGVSRAPAGLPVPVARFRDLAVALGPRSMESVRIEARATMRRPGLPAIPLRIAMIHRLGFDFVHDIGLGFGPFTIRLGLDALVDGAGIMKIGPVTDVGPTIDQGALISLWGEALGFPCAWDRLPGLRWDAVDADAARLCIPSPDGTVELTVLFDPATGYPATCEADRHKGRGPKVHWCGSYLDWRRFDRGVLAPARFLVEWADEPRPWLDVRVERVLVDGPIAPDIERARRAIAAAS